MYKIYEELSKRGISLESIQYGDYQRSELISEIQENINSWEYNVLELLDINNWNLKNLILEKPDHFIRGNIPYESNIRKPKAYFGLLITGKGNLALDWFPYDMTSFRMPIEKTDWLHWDNTWPRGSGDLPFNRVLMIRGFANLLNPPKNKPYPKLDQLIRSIYDFPELYDSFFEQPPVGVEPRKKKGQIIKVDFVSDNPL